VNKKQHISIWVGVTIALLIGIFPLWEGYSQWTYNEYQESTIVKFHRMGHKIDPNFINPAALEIPPSMFPMYFQKTKYRFILTPPHPEVYNEPGHDGQTIAPYKIDFGTLIVRWFLVSFITFGAVCSLKSERGEHGI
jgi:hypothetical protein